MTRRQTRVLLAVLVALIGGAVWFTTDYLLARRALAHGREALAAGDTPAARDWLARALATLPHDPEAHYLAAVAARHMGDRTAAARHLDEAANGGWDPDAVVVERALQHSASGGAFARVEPVLRRAAEGDGPAAADAMVVVVRGYLAQFRLSDADALTARWVNAHPTDSRAWALRADVLERLERKEPARGAFIRWVELAPDDTTARLGLVRHMLAGRRPPSEVAPHMDMLLATTPNDPEVQRLLAGLREAEGRPGEAAAVLDRLIAGPDPSQKTLNQRARLSLEQGRSDEALRFARLAVAAEPSDPEALYTLFRCLQQTGPATEAAEAEARWKQVQEDLDRVRVLARRVSAAPTDPEPRRELGELFLRHGRVVDGVRWLESALAVEPGHAPTLRTLADYQARSNRTNQATRPASPTVP